MNENKWEIKWKLKVFGWRGIELAKINVNRWKIIQWVLIFLKLFPPYFFSSKHPNFFASSLNHFHPSMKESILHDSEKIKC